MLKEIKNDSLKKHWYYLSTLIILFVIGYFLYLLNKITNMFISLSLHDLFEIILLFGAVFVILILYMIQKLLKNMNQIQTELESTLETSEIQKKQLEKQKINLQKSKKELDDKNKELNELIDDFYSLTLNINDKGKVSILKKNKKIT